MSLRRRRMRNRQIWGPDSSGSFGRRHRNKYGATCRRCGARFPARSSPTPDKCPACYRQDAKIWEHNKKVLEK